MANNLTFTDIPEIDSDYSLSDYDDVFIDENETIKDKETEEKEKIEKTNKSQPKLMSSKEKFKQKRKLWQKQERMTAKQRISNIGDQNNIEKWEKVITRNESKKLKDAIEINDWPRVISLLEKTESNKEKLTLANVKRLSNMIRMSIYRGTYSYRGVALKIALFPEKTRCSVAAVNLCCPKKLLEYMNFPSLAFKLNQSNTGESLWRRIPSHERINMYRKAFEAGACFTGVRFTELHFLY